MASRNHQTTVQSASQKASAMVLEIADRVFRQPNSSVVCGDRMSVETNWEASTMPYSGIMNDISDTACVSYSNEDPCQTMPRKSSENVEDSGVSSPRKNSFSTENECTEERKSRIVMKTIEKMCQLHNEQVKMLTAELTAHCETLHKKISNLNSLPVLEKRLLLFELLNEHLRKMLAESQSIREKLSKMVYHDVLDVHYDYHKIIVELFEDGDSVMRNLERNVDIVNWHKQNNLEASTKVDSYLSALEKLIIRLQAKLNSLAHFRTLVGKAAVK